MSARSVASIVDAYNSAGFGGRLFVNAGRIDGSWLIGNDYTNKSRYYGAFPHGFLKRVMAMFPWVEPWQVLHLFSGSLTKYDARGGVRADVDPRCRPEWCGPAEEIHLLPRHLLRVGSPRLCIADPPYSPEDAQRYRAKAYPNKRLVFQSLAKLMAPGSHVVWLDTCWPMHRKVEWEWIGHIQLIRSTNHRVRLVSVFERKVNQ